jgi:ATP-dependent helicase Lhr and Lhr-like helicase
MEMQAAFDNLAPFVQEFIYRQAWQELRPLQVEAVHAVLHNNGDILITTGTASGKTEAAFFPVLSMISLEPVGSVKVLYVGPLKALINDQFRRLEPLCEQGGIPIHRWHGDIAGTQKSDLIDHPGGVLQITPESIESLLINKTKSLRRLFSRLEFIVIDEVHTFLESDRGLQLQSQLDRLSNYCNKRPRRIGLSATIGDVDVAKRWINPDDSTAVILINPIIEIPPTRLSHLHFINSKVDISEELLDDLFSLTCNRKALIFCNSRRYVEQITTQLNRRCHRDHLEERYFPHHGSISKEIREEAETKMREEDHPHSVVCTNTLELGIDIGQLELTIQIDSTHSVMSFVQRLGRTGRKYGAPRVMQIYTSEPTPEQNDLFYERIPFSLLKSIAVVNLFIQGWIEPPELKQLPYHILYHQILSHLIEMNGSTPRDLASTFYQRGVFNKIPIEDYELLFKHLAEIDHIEQLDTGEMILGLEGEKVARSRDFYAVFQTPPEWDVIAGEKNIGRISPSPDLAPGTCLMLGGQLWEVIEIYPEQKQVMVKRARDAHDVLFEGTGVPEMHPRIAKKVFEILCDNEEPGYLSTLAVTRLKESRRLFSDLELTTNNYIEGENCWVVFPWTGTKIARTLALLIKESGYQSEFPNMLFPWVMVVKRPAPSTSWKSLLITLQEKALEIENDFKLISNIPDQLLRIYKFDQYLPEDLIRKRAAADWVDWNGAITWLKSVILL